MTCNDGTLSPSTFSCLEDCTLPTVDDSSACGDGSSISGNDGTCVPSCGTGYTLVGSKMTCNNGTLSPSTFSCLEDCSLPTIADSSACGDGSSIAGTGATCDPSCGTG